MWRDVFLFLVIVRGHPADTDCSPQVLASLFNLRCDSGEAGFEPAFRGLATVLPVHHSPVKVRFKVNRKPRLLVLLNVLIHSGCYNADAERPKDADND